MRGAGMGLLIAATALMVAGHVLPGWPPVRAAMLAKLGRGPFLAAHSALSLVALGLVVLAYRLAAPGPWLFTPGPVDRWLAVVAMLPVVALLVGRLTTPAKGEVAHGIYRITAVPGSLALLLWCLLHLLNVAEARLTVVFTGMAAIALFALVKNWHQAPPGRRRAGLLPFAGVIAGRERLVLAEIGWWRLGLAVLDLSGPAPAPSAGDRRRSARRFFLTRVKPQGGQLW